MTTTKENQKSNSTMGKKLNIIICGGGLGGLACAIGLKRKGHTVTILEGSHTLSEVGAGIQMPPNCVRILEGYGIADKFKDAITIPKNIVLRRYSNGKPLSTTPLDPLMSDSYGFPYWLIHRADYQRILWETAVELGIKYQIDSRVDYVDDDTNTVYLVTGEAYHADVIVGADGIRSRVRDTAVITEEVILPIASPQCAYRATVPREVMLSDPKIAHLMTDVNANNWIGYRRHIMAYPMKNGEMYNLVMAHPGQAPIGTWNMPGNVDELKEHYKSFDPVIRQVLTHVTHCLEWVLADLPPLPRWVSPKGRVVLIGDAAHAMLPFLSQGAAQAVEDGCTLAEELDSVNSLDDLPEALRKFERKRKRRAEIVQLGGRKNQHIWHLPDGEEQEERDRLMKEKDSENPDQWSDVKFQRWLFGWNAFDSTF
ncbi:unnamed protein product [Kuraishia capsulata CBS 1993]|uniref:FAD-binding domain-containing protein n=1 Tax=Kuraishia capsulata CBS 1993 TaxID=1382522 RepID=W6MJ53_9ASCO|nr:uncharacterized protein KUCA_T00002232001 [Kuraishia capsulata CBS 1993]CDK26261.1 unnamed protein product [Kuraishia capsulata CBS 1993]